MRLKGGDPFVFGRGGEEAQALRAAGIPFEVVPGVTAGVAAPAYAGIPVTQRGLASAVAFVTGHEDPGKAETHVDWAALARFPGTLVFYMGVRRLPRIAEQLVAAGRDAGRAGGGRRARDAARPAQRARDAGDDRRRGRRAGIGAPAITVVGPVAALRDELDWLAAGPPAQRASRSRSPARGAQAGALAARLRALGAAVVEAPAIRIEPLDDGPRPRRLRPASASRAPTAPSSCSPACATRGRWPARGSRRSARDGAGPARGRRRGRRRARAGGRRVARGGARDVPVRRALVVRAEEARDVLPDALRARGAEVDVVALYRTVREPLDDDARAPRWGPTTSPSPRRRPSASSARRRGSLDGPRLVSIGPVTSAELRRLGAEPDVEAAEHTPDGLVAALVADATRRAPLGCRRVRILVLGAGGVGPPSRPSPAGARSSSAWSSPTSTSGGRGRPSSATATRGWPRSRSTRATRTRWHELARAERADAILNACDPWLNPPIFRAALAARCTYLDMAMTLSRPHPERPYEQPGVMLGDEQFAAGGAVGGGRPAGARGHRGRARAVRRVRPPRRRRAVLRDRRGRRARRRRPRGRRLRLRADVLRLDDDRGVPQPAADLGARARLLHDAAVLRARGVRVPRGIGPVECVNVEHEEVVLIPRWVDCRRVTFKYGLGEEFIDVLKTLHKLGLDRTEPIDVRGARWRRATWWPPPCPTPRAWATA